MNCTDVYNVHWHYCTNVRTTTMVVVRIFSSSIENEKKPTPGFEGKQGRIPGPEKKEK